MKSIIFSAPMIIKVMTCSKCGHISPTVPCRCGSAEFVKTMTRRLRGLKKINEFPDDFAKAVQLKADGTWSFWYPGGKGIEEFAQKAYPNGGGIKSPYQVGDVLYCRETWQNCPDDCHISHGKLFTMRVCSAHQLRYRATDSDPSGIKWRSPIHMPQWASRAHIEIASVKVERLQDISEEDAIREGCEGYFGGEADCSDFSYQDNSMSAKDEFKELWQSLHGTGSWDANQWVFCYEFRRVR